MEIYLSIWSSIVLGGLRIREMLIIFLIHLLVKQDFLEEKHLSTLVCSPKHEPFAKLVDNTDDGGGILQNTSGVNQYSRKMFHPTYKE